jgi:predicted PurR-regulated permease PerM
MHRERRSRHMGWRSQDVIRAAALVIAMYLGIRLLWFAYPLVFATFLGVLFGLAVSSGVDKLERYRIPRGVAAAIMVVGFIGALVGVVAWSAPTLRRQSQELRVKLPQAIDNVDRWIESQRGGMLGALLGGEGGGSPPPAGQNAGAGTASAPGAAPERRDSAEPSRPAGGLAPPRPEERVAQADQAADSAAAASTSDTTRRDASRSGGGLRGRVVAQVAGARQYMFGFLTSTFAAVAGLLLVIVLTIYVATDPDTYHRGLMHLFPHSARTRAGEVLSVMAATLRRWLRTQLIAMIAIGVVTTVALFILGIPAAIPLGILAGLLEFIPTIGPVLSAIPAVLMGFVISPEKALTVALVYTAIQLVENHLLIPMLMKEGMDLPPALTIISQALMGMIFGFLGLLVAVPILAATIVGVKMLYVEGVVGDEVDLGEDDDD